MDETIIKEILKKYKITPLDIKKADNSYNSNVYIIITSRKKYILKIYKNKTKRLNEKKYYNYLYNIIPTSKVLYSSSHNNFEFNIISYFSGRNIYDEKYNCLKSDEIFNIGKVLAKIHNSKIISTSTSSWIEYLNSCIDKTKKELNYLFGKKDNDIIINFLKDYINNNIVNNYKDCLLHMDFRIGNIIINNQGKVGVIDFESMKNGEYVFDFVKMNRIFNKHNFKIFLDGYKSIRKLSKDFDEKLKFYSFFDSYTSLYWCYVNNHTNSNFYKLNYTIVMEYLKELKNKK